MRVSEPWLDDPLGYLIGAERVVEFLARGYERDPLVVHHNAPKRFEGLLSIDAVDRIVTGTDLREGQLDMANASRQMMRSDYLDGAGYVDRGAVAELYRAGSTIILNQAHQLDPTLGRLCRGLEHTFSAHVQTNLYLTPPNAQGFRTHYDNHDVLVIQIEGEKTWRLYDKPIDTPYRGEGFELGKFEAGELKQEFTLKAGDCAYVPRGLMHDALTPGDAASLHITIGLITRTWADLMLEAVSEVALRRAEFRKSLPAGYARTGHNRASARAYMAQLLNIAAQEALLDPALDLIADEFIRSRPADNRFALRDAIKPVSADEKFQLKRHAHFRLAEDGDKLVLICPGGELDFAPTARAAIERALNGKPFAPSELGADDATTIAARLLAYGLVERF
ncbi:myc induced nuclear antigen [alpha proteobacterium U9-1i]|nr:myc induced nuclear antigen [alpha proteobacterium U9-1i]